MEYDVQQHELAALNPAHDLSTLDTAALTIIATHPFLASVPHALSMPPKCSAPLDMPASLPKKRLKPSCFRCGRSGHLPGDCHAESTVTGQWTAPIAPDAKSRHVLLAPNGKHFCFNWARNSSCAFNSTCINYHGCSICSANSQGAGSCQQA